MILWERRIGEVNRRGMCVVMSIDGWWRREDNGSVDGYFHVIKINRY